MHLHRNSLACLVRHLFPSDLHICMSDGMHPFMLSTAYLAMSRDMVDRFAPVRLKFSGRARSRCSIAGFIAPSAASLSASSFPSSPLWPLTHWKAVWLFLILSQAAVVLKSLWFVTPIQPLSSHSSRRSVSPSITYLELLLISRRTCVGVFFATCRTAYSSPVWLLWSGPGTLRALLPGSLCPYQTPLPAWAF